MLSTGYPGSLAQHALLCGFAQTGASSSPPIMDDDDILLIMVDEITYY